MLTLLDHVTIAVTDVATATRHYQALLGVAPRWCGTHPDAGTAAALFALTNAVVELMGPAPGAERAEQTEGLRALLETRGEGLTTLSFGSDDAASASKKLRERGVRATPPRAGEAHGDDGTVRHYQLVELSPRATRALPISVVQRPESLLRDSKVTAPSELAALDHVVIRTGDPEAALALYGTAMGLRLALDKTVFDTRMLFFRVGGVTLEVIDDPSLADSDVLHGLAYRVGDLSAARSRLQAAGFTLTESREGRKPGTQVFGVRDQTHGVPTLVLRDPSRD